MRTMLFSSVFLFGTSIVAVAQPQCSIANAAPVAVQASDLRTPPDPVPTASADPSLPPSLRHVRDAGAQLTDIGVSHGLHSYVARSGKQFMFLHSTPDGQALVSGMVSELTPSQLLAAAVGQARELGVSHGLRGIFVSDGNQFQVFYVTPDAERVVAGAMWDFTGKNLTREQVTPIPGAVATVEIGPGASGIPVDRPAGQPAAAQSILERTTAGLYGDAAAPKVWMFVDPLCPFSVRAMQQLQPLVAAKRLQLAVVPIAINDHENGNRSTQDALSMVSLPPDQMVAAWSAGRLTAPVGTDGSSRLAANQAAADAIGLRGTPTLIWRKTDGLGGRSDGVPSDMSTFLASLGSVQ
jgi:thiol:disulfide interchange protein DsbG